MYTPDGQAVQMIQKIEQGYLGKIIYEDLCADEEEGEFTAEYIADDKILFFEVLLDSPLTEAYATEVKKFKREQQKLQEEIDNLRNIKRSEEGLLHKISKFPFVQKLVDYVTGDYQFVLYLRDYDVRLRQNIWTSTKISVCNFKDT